MPSHEPPTLGQRVWMRLQTRTVRDAAAPPATHARRGWRRWLKALLNALSWSDRP